MTKSDLSVAFTKTRAEEAIGKTGPSSTLNMSIGHDFSDTEYVLSYVALNFLK